MSRNSALVLALALGSLILPARAFAQLTPPAGSAGAGNSAISGVPFGPANPRVLSDPSGIGNASLIPPLRTNPPEERRHPRPQLHRRRLNRLNREPRLHIPQPRHTCFSR